MDGLSDGEVGIDDVLGRGKSGGFDETSMKAAGERKGYVYDELSTVVVKE